MSRGWRTGLGRQPAACGVADSTELFGGNEVGDMPLVEYTRDRLHREVLRRFGSGTDATNRKHHV
ncbi:hypothetical protein KCP76_20340 [Salmonella enterica subsp. enterica serovar Weltevreden]|nr:hypothetical protein KCP76_20340 [Salmonella enterica subsp. enterica serovar Weltevreden]